MASAKSRESVDSAVALNALNALNARIFFPDVEVAAVVEEVEAGAADALDGVLTGDHDHHR
jgi:hypothetical protein